MLVVGGLVLAGVFAAQAYSANQVIQTVESSTGVKIARGLALISRFVSQASLVGSLLDPRNQTIYLIAQAHYTEGVFGAIAGGAMAIVGFVTAALWSPKPVPAGAAPAAAGPHGWRTIGLAVALAATILFGVRQLQDSPAAAVDEPATATPIGSPTPARVGAAPGQVVSGQQAPAAAPTPTGTFYRAAPFGPVKVDAHNVYVVQLGAMARGTEVRAVLSVEYNNRLSNTFGAPDIAVHLAGACKGAGDWIRARNATQLSFQVPLDGDCSIVFDNSYSAVNSKQIGLQFLQP